jgi:RNA polymerase sigma-70 factor (ECF subfamily)
MPDKSEALSDETLFERVCRNEKELYRVLFDRHKRRVSRIVFNMTGASHEIDDLVSEVFLTTYQKRNQFRGEGSFAAWLYRIAINVGRQYNRKRQTRQKVVHEFYSSIETMDSSPNALEKGFEKSELRDQIKKCISAMSPKLREVFILRELEEMSYEEIAATLNCPVGTVRSRLNSARTLALGLLQQLLDKQEKQREKDL